MFELIKNFRTKTHNPMRENATELLAHFSGSLAALRLLATTWLRRRCALPGSRKNAHSTLSNKGT